MTRFVRARGTPPWLVVYALGLLCVCSFVLFEVLDVDGSDFDYTPSRLSIKLAEAGHDDIRRIPLLVAGPAPVPVGMEDVRGPTPTIARRPGQLDHVPPSLARMSRAVLARARLSDVPPSA